MNRLPGANYYSRVKPEKPKSEKPDKPAENDDKIPFPKEIVTPEYRHGPQEDGGPSLTTKIEIALGITIGVFILLAVLEK